MDIAAEISDSRAALEELLGTADAANWTTPRAYLKVTISVTRVRARAGL